MYGTQRRSEDEDNKSFFTFFKDDEYHQKPTEIVYLIHLETLITVGWGNERWSSEDAQEKDVMKKEARAE